MHALLGVEQKEGWGGVERRIEGRACLPPPVVADALADPRTRSSCVFFAPHALQLLARLRKQLHQSWVALALQVVIPHPKNSDKDVVVFLDAAQVGVGWGPGRRLRGRAYCQHFQCLC